MTWRRRHWFGAALAAGFAVAVVSFTVAQAQRYAPAATAIRIEAVPITAFDNRDPGQLRFGALEFRGGLALTSDNQAFGGISGLHMETDGAHFLAVTDRGSWLRGRITYKDGRPDGIADAELAPFLAADGKPLAAQGVYDAESLTEHDGKMYIGFERVQQIMRFDYRRDGLSARAEPVKVPADFKTLASNRSLECLASPPPGSPLAGNLIVITERSLDATGNHRAFLLKDGGVERFTVRRSDDFDVSDCAILPPGDLLILERGFSLLRGVDMRIRRVALSSIKPGGVIDGPALVRADLGFQIDNMEGIGIHRNARGEIILTLMSDDNFSVLQRNLLLQFALVGE